MIEQTDLFEPRGKVDVAIARLREFEPTDGYFLAYSGGKDSTVLLALAKLSGVQFDAHYNATTIDPPELVHFVRSQPDVGINWPRKPFLARLVEKGMPLRQRRWCCAEYKETGGSGRVVLTGIRHAESRRRAARRMVESCLRDKRKRYVHPILDWTDDDVWSFIRSRSIPYCSLYDEGFKRLGCVLCPMAGPRARAVEAARWPKIADAFRRAFVRLWNLECVERKSGRSKALKKWNTGSEMFDWWMRNEASPDPSQTGLDFAADDDAVGVYEVEP